MLLAIDIGNTQTHIGVFDDDELAQHWRLTTDGDATADEIAVRVAGLMDLRGIELNRIDGAVASCVVPRLDPEYRQMCERYLDTECLMVGPGVRSGMAVMIDNPHELGADRLVNAVAAYERFGGACASVDFGTAVNFDAVSAGGEYLGGVIGPGVEISLSALTERAAKLPKIEIAPPEAVIGTTTRGSVQSGIVYGFAGAVDAIARRIEAELGPEMEFIATGGQARAIVPFCEMVDEIDDLLTLTGLRLVHARN
jgi:type III pantothenate kinase